MFPLLLAFGVAFLVRATYVALQSRLQLFNLSFVADDALLYLDLAQNLADGRGMTYQGRPTAYVGPGYPLFLAGLLRLGVDPVGVGLVQAMLGAFTAVLAGLTAGELARAVALRKRDRRLAIVLAAFAAALYPHLVFWTGYVLTETLFVFLVAASLYTWLAAARRGAPRLALLAGLLAAVAALTRPPFFAIGLALLAFWIALVRRSGAAATRSLLLPALFAAGLAAPLAAWTARNAVELGTPIVTTTESGYIFYQGNSRDATGGSRGYVDAKDFVPLEAPSGDEVRRDAFYLERAVGDIVDDPLAALRRLPAKVVNMWRPTYEDASPRNVVITMATYLPVLVFGLAGMGWLGRSRGVALVPAVVLSTWFLVHVAVTGMIRFRLAAELVLLEALPFGVLAAVGWARGRARDQEHRV